MYYNKALNNLAECLKMHVTPMVENHFEMLWKLLKKANGIVTVAPSLFRIQNYKWTSNWNSKSKDK